MAPKSRNSSEVVRRSDRLRSKLEPPNESDKGKSAKTSKRESAKTSKMVSKRKYAKTSKRSKSETTTMPETTTTPETTTMPETSTMPVCFEEAETMTPLKNPAKDRVMRYCGISSGILKKIPFCAFSCGIEKIMRENREGEARHFKKIYMLNEDCLEDKTCIHPGGSFDWSESSFGITWVAFRGTRSTYVAFRKTLDKVRDRLTSYLVYNPASITFDFLGTSIISEVEVMADLPSQSSQKFPETCNGQHVHDPFAIVSVVPGTFNDKGKHVDKEAAVKFLRGEIDKDKIVYPYAAQMAAVGALQKLYDQTFKPEDIWVHEAFFGEEQGLSVNDIMHILKRVSGVYPPLMG